MIKISTEQITTTITTTKLLLLLGLIFLINIQRVIRNKIVVPQGTQLLGYVVKIQGIFGNVVILLLLCMLRR